MASTVTIELVDGVRVVVPDKLDLITPYILLEQRDWFEDEIQFVRRLLKKDQLVVDIGANYGVYTLSMAKAVGPNGRVWAFEPASDTARLLNEAIAINGFSQIVLERKALSSAGGNARLSLNANSELNALTRDAQAGGASETVTLTTLDDCMRRFGWRNMDFVKMDAEGEESNILKGGKTFFAELSPLVQYEIKVGHGLHMGLAEEFAVLGYESYRLVPGLELLIPFDRDATPDEYLLNLFCCKRDRAERLAAQGLLADVPGRIQVNGKGDARHDAERLAQGHVYGWRNTIARLPYAARLAGLWERTMAAAGHAEVDRALALYAVSEDASLAPAERVAALAASFNLLKTLCERQPSHLRLATMARVARDYGERSLAVDALDQLNGVIARNGRVDLDEPFLVPAKRFDSVAPGEAPGNWVLAAALEELERLAAYSSFYTGVDARPRLEAIRALGFGSEEMERRLGLLKERFRLSA